MLLISILVMAYDVTNGAVFFIPTNLTSGALDMSLQCNYDVRVRSRLESATVCTSYASCLAFGAEKWPTSSFWCACPKQITWPGSWSATVSTMHMEYMTESLPGIPILWTTHKMASISQTTFTRAFIWMKSFVFWYKFHWSLFLGPNGQ